MLHYLKNKLPNNFREYATHDKIAGVVLALALLSFSFFDYKNDLALFFRTLTIIVLVIWFLFIWTKPFVSPSIQQKIAPRIFSLLLLLGIWGLLNIRTVIDQQQYGKLKQGLDHLAYLAGYMNLYFHHDFEDDLLTFSLDPNKPQLHVGCIPSSKNPVDLGINNVKSTPYLFEDIRNILEEYNIQSFEMNAVSILFRISPYKGVRYYFQSKQPQHVGRKIIDQWYWEDF